MADSTVNRAFKAISRRNAMAHGHKSTLGTSFNPQSSEFAESGRTAERGIHQAKRRTKFEDQSKVNPVYKWR